jgi:hypothetical protein
VICSNALKETFPEDLERDLEEGAVGWKHMPVFYGFLADNHGFMPGYEVCRHRSSVIIDLCYWLIVPYEPYRPKPGNGPPSRDAIPAYPLYNETPGRQKAVTSFEDYARLLDPNPPGGAHVQSRQQFRAQTLPACLPPKGPEQPSQPRLPSFSGVQLLRHSFPRVIEVGVG